MHETYFDRGFRVVAISSEPKATLESVFVKKHNARYWIGSDPDNTTFRQFMDGDSVRLPKFYVVNSEGKVVGDGIPTEAQIEELLKAVVDLRLDRELQPALAGAAWHYRAGVLSVAHRIASAHKDDNDKAIAADAAFLLQKISEADATLKKQSQHTLAADAGPLYCQLLTWQYLHRGLPLGDWAKEACATLRKDRRKWGSLKPVSAALRQLENALEREAKGSDQPFDRQRITDLYQKMVTGDGGTATIARQRLAARRKADEAKKKG